MPKIQLSAMNIVGKIDNSKLPTTLLLQSNPTQAMQAATKEYVDNDTDALTLNGASPSTTGTADSIAKRDASGNIVAVAFSGSGASLTALSASNISAGTLDSARLPAIPDSKLDTISTAGKVANTATTATTASTGGTIVLRDSNGNFSAGTVTATAFSGSGASLTGLSAANISAGTLDAARLPSIPDSKLDTISTAGKVANSATTATTSTTGSTIVLRDGAGGVSAVSFSGSGASLTALNAANISTGTLDAARLPSIPDSKLDTISTAGKVANTATTATKDNTASTIVLRDSGGNFSAGTISATFSGNGTNITALNASNVTTGILPETVLPKATARYADMFLLMGA